MMRGCQESNFEKMGGKVTARERIIAGVVFGVILGLFVFLYGCGAGWVDTDMLFGICGFKQSYGLPCPGCYFTTAGVAFAHGRIVESFYIQPGAGVVCSLLAAGGVFSLLISVFGVYFGFLHKLRVWQTVKYMIVLVIVLILGGWGVTLVRALKGNVG